MRHVHDVAWWSRAKNGRKRGEDGSRQHTGDGSSGRNASPARANCFNEDAKCEYC